MKKWILLLLTVVLVLSLCACGGNQSIVEEPEGPDGIEFFGGIWYDEGRDLWLEVYYDGTWCTFVDGGMLSSYGSLTIEGMVSTLTPTEGSDHYVLTAGEDILTDENGQELFHVTEVGIRKPLIVNELDVPDILAPDTVVDGEVATSFAMEYAGFYISEDGIYGLDVYEDGTYDLQEFGLLVESGSFLRLTEPAYHEIYAIDPDMRQYRLVLAQEERIYLGGCGAFAPGTKAVNPEE